MKTDGLDKTDIINDINKEFAKNECKNIGKFIRKCPDCGKEKEYKTKYSLNYAINNNSKCDNCKPKYKKYTQEDFIRIANEVHKGKYSYTKTVYVMTESYVIITCPIHGDFIQMACRHLAGQGCKQCANDKLKINQLLTTEEFIERSKKRHKDRFEYERTVYTHSDEYVIITCKIHGDFLQIANNNLNGCGCPKCSYVVSKPELEFLNELKILDVNRHKYLYPYQLDAFIPEEKLIYEFLGDYWHGNPKKFNPCDINRVNHTTFKKLYDKTVIKFKKLTKKGYIIKYIWEDDYAKWIKNGKQGEIPIELFNGIDLKYKIEDYIDNIPF